MPQPMACTAWARVMAGPQVKSLVPGAMWQSCTPGTGAPAMPISTGTTLQCAAAAIWHTLVRRAARFCSTARVTLASVWLTPWATTPLSAHSTSTARRAKSSSGVPVRAAASSSMVSRLPSPPSGLASAAQWACAAARAASSGGVMVCSRVFSSGSVIPFSLFLFGHTAPQPLQSAAAVGCPPSIDAGTPHTDARWQSRSPNGGHWLFGRQKRCRCRWNPNGGTHARAPAPLRGRACCPPAG